MLVHDNACLSKFQPLCHPLNRKPIMSFTSKRILVTGITSIHGWPIFSRLTATHPADALLGVRPPTVADIPSKNTKAVCITDKRQLRDIRDKFRPTHIINAAGVCDLDVCEQRPEWAFNLNADGPKTIAAIFGDSARIIHISTDLVFSGATTPEGGYCETDIPDPISVVGKSFMAGEHEITSAPHHCIVRLGLPIGPSFTGDKGAIDWIESRFRRNRPVTLFVDEWRSCIRCLELAEKIQSLVDRDASGTYHCGGDWPISLHTIGRYVVAQGGYDRTLLKGIKRSEEKNGPPRVENVALNSEKLKRFLLQKTAFF